MPSRSPNSVSAGLPADTPLISSKTPVAGLLVVSVNRPSPESPALTCCPRSAAANAAFTSSTKCSTVVFPGATDTCIDTGRPPPTLSSKVPWDDSRPLPGRGSSPCSVTPNGSSVTPKTISPSRLPPKVTKLSDLTAARGSRSMSMLNAVVAGSKSCRKLKW